MRTQETEQIHIGGLMAQVPVTIGICVFLQAIYKLRGLNVRSLNALGMVWKSSVRQLLYRVLNWTRGSSRCLRNL